MNWKCACAVLILLTALFPEARTMLVNVEVQQGPRGPRAPACNLVFHTGVDSLYASLKAGEIDVMSWPLTAAQYSDAVADPDILLAPTNRSDVHAFSFNNNYTIAAYPGVKNPLTVTDFRKALAHLVDKTYILNFIAEGFGDIIDVPIPSTSSFWWNASITGFNYPYPFDMAQAAVELDALGFTDTDDVDTYRNYPADWPGRPGRPNVDPFLFYACSEDWILLAAGRHLRDNLQSVGFQVDWRPEPSSLSNGPVMINRNYHIYTAWWEAERFPTYLYDWFHSSRWFPYGSNFLTGLPGYPSLDLVLEQLRYAPSPTLAVTAAQEAQGLIIEEYAILVPFMSYKGFYAYRNLLGVANMEASGPENVYTWMNAYRLDNSALPIRMGIKQPPVSLNPIYSSWDWDLSTMSLFMADPLSVAPYEIYEVDQPWLAKDWDFQLNGWKEDDINRSKSTWWLPNDASWIQPITGSVIEPFTTSFYEFNAWYYYQTPDSWAHLAYKDLDHIRVIGPYEVELYWNAKSIWMQYNGFGRFLYTPAGASTGGYKSAPLATLQTNIFAGPLAAGTALPLLWRTVGAPVQIVSITLDGLTLTPYTDYDMIEGHITILVTIPAESSITVTYWARGDAEGFFPGGRSDWNNLLIGPGPWYLTEIQPGAGGWATYKANRNFFLETPPLGEIDWYHFYDDPEAPKPRSGYWLVDINDVTSAYYAYQSTGHAIPSPNWIPGADLKAGPIPPLPGDRAGRIDVYDLSSVQGQYGVKFWIQTSDPPPVMLPTSQALEPTSKPLSYNTAFPTDKPLVYVYPQLVHGAQNELVAVGVQIHNLTDTYLQDSWIPWMRRPLGNLYGFDIMFSWDPTILEYVTHEVTIPIEYYPEGVLHDPATGIEDNVNPVGGTFKISYSSMYPADRFNNPGQSNTVFNMTFKVKTEGASLLTLNLIKLSAVSIPPRRGKNILHYKWDGLFTIPGDANGDRKVDNSDLLDLVQAYGSEPSKPNWNPNCDFNRDRIIDAKDLSALGRNYGKTV